VIRTDADSEYIKQIEAGRIHFMEQDAEQMHGPIFEAPAPNEQFLEPNEIYPTLDDPNTPTSNMDGLSVPLPLPSAVGTEGASSRRQRKPGRPTIQPVSFSK